MSSLLGDLLLQQVQRSKDKSAVVVQFAATLPGDGSQVSLDWWLRQMNTALGSQNVPISLEFADVDQPARLVSDGESSAIKVTQLKRRIEEMQAYIDDLESNLHEKAEALAVGMNGRGAGLSSKDQAVRAVEEDGFYIDSKRQRWVSIEAEAARLGKAYITVWRAAKKIGPNTIEAWVVGETQAGGDRILVKQGSFTSGKRRKKGQKST